MSTRLCPRCHKSGFVAEVGFNRPRFRCQGCDHTWTSGHFGGPYFVEAQNTKGRSYVEFREHKPHAIDPAALHLAKEEQ